MKQQPVFQNNEIPIHNSLTHEQKLLQKINSALVWDGCVSPEMHGELIKEIVTTLNRKKD